MKMLILFNVLGLAHKFEPGMFSTPFARWERFPKYAYNLVCLCVLVVVRDQIDTRLTHLVARLEKFTYVCSHLKHSSRVLFEKLHAKPFASPLN
ncbi:hypothetical protein [Paraburkholderia hospita]|uniref:hypothetical protein n=1 Tax=Paraburkholderia hospita TaxID=169430 RepID=UPI0013F1704F|nr:hypothetical protein [Paraburkholderia hospita]